MTQYLTGNPQIDLLIGMIVGFIIPYGVFLWR